MKAFALTYDGLGPETVSEINKLINSSPQIEGPMVLFEVSTVKELAKFAYKAQSVSKTGLLLLKKEFKSLKDLKKPILNIDLSNFFSKELSFAVRCKKDDPDLITRDIEQLIGSFLFKNFEKNNIKPKVDLNHPLLPFFVLINKNIFYLCLDFSGFDLSKRDYKVFPHRLDIKGNLAYSFLLFSEYSSNTIMLNPFCKSATIAIEAALASSNISPNFFKKRDFSFINFPQFRELDTNKFFSQLDKIKIPKRPKIFAYDSLLKNLNAARKNAKIADINKFIQFSKTSLEDIDLKFEEEVDLICSFPPQLNKFNQREILKIYQELFHQAKLVLKKDGKVSLIVFDSQLFKEKAEKNNFELIKQKEIKSGQRSLFFLLFALKKGKA